ALEFLVCLVLLRGWRCRIGARDMEEHPGHQDSCVSCHTCSLYMGVMATLEKHTTCQKASAVVHRTGHIALGQPTAYWSQTSTDAKYIIVRGRRSWGQGHLSQRDQAFYALGVTTVTRGVGNAKLILAISGSPPGARSPR